MKHIFLKTKLFIPLLLLLVLCSCKTYYISVDNLRLQFANVDSTSFREMVLGGVVYGAYLANPIKIIHCTDKKGGLHQLENKPSVEVRFTYGKNNKRTIFYFDRLFVNDSVVIGAQSRFLPNMMKTIPLNEITKIEVQDDKKNFHYVAK